MADLSSDRVRELLNYDPISGVVTRKVSIARCVRVGDVAGTLQKSTGYRRICVDGRVYREHRIMWLHAHGAWPAGEVDHINGMRSDNRIENLRDASRAINRQNLKSAQSNNTTSGMLGVTWKKSHKKWVASIRVDGLLRQIGYFSAKEDAHNAYLLEKRRLHPGCSI